MQNIPNEIREDMLKVKRMVSEVEIILGKREGETELVNKLIDAENLLTYCMSRLENAIVPHCKVGQTVWFIRNGKIVEIEVEKIILKSKGLYFKLGCNAMYETSCNSISKTVFLTREEAEQALKERLNNG